MGVDEGGRAEEVLFIGALLHLSSVGTVMPVVSYLSPQSGH